jgi:hypothetical protein
VPEIDLVTAFPPERIEIVARIRFPLAADGIAKTHVAWPWLNECESGLSRLPWIRATHVVSPLATVTPLWVRTALMRNVKRLDACGPVGVVEKLSTMSGRIS